MSKNLTIICPCCEARLTVDHETGAILAHEEKGKKSASFDELRKNLDSQKEARQNIFAQELNQQKDRSRLLEEKFKEAFKRAETDVDKDRPFQNPLELD